MPNQEPDLNDEIQEMQEEEEAVQDQQAGHENLDEEQEPGEPSTHTLRRLLELFDTAKHVMENEDPNPERVKNVGVSISNAITIYKDMFNRRVNARQQRRITEFFRQCQQEGAQHEESEHETSVKNADSDSNDVVPRFGGFDSDDEHRQGEGGAPTRAAAQAAWDDEAAGPSTSQ